MKPATFALTLKTKLVLFFLILALAPLAAIGAFSIRITEDIVVSLVLRQLENVAQDKAALLERWLGERKADMQVIAGTSILSTMDPDAIGAYLELIRKHYGVYKELSVVDRSHRIVFTTGGSGVAPEMTRRESSGGSAALRLSGITYLPHETESTFRIAAPIPDPENPKGVIYGTVGTHNIIVTVLNVALGRTGECYLVDKNGTFLAHKDPHRILAQNISQSDSFKNIFGVRDRKKTYLDYRGIEVLGTSQKVDGTDWYLVVEQDRAEAFESVTLLKRYLYITVLLCIGSAFLITWVVSYHVVRPIRALSLSAQGLAEAKFERTGFQTDRRDEIGMLYHAFQDMAEKVSERQNSLERKVNLKEAELKETDLVLKQIKLIAERSEKFAAIGRLGAAVAHEIRTPLTSLKLFLESIQAEIEISREYEEDFSIAMGQVRRIETAINRFLEYSKPQQFKFTEISVAHLIDEVVAMIRPMANKQECRLEVVLEEHLPMIDADKQFLEEALVNLLVNSLEAMSGKGRLTVSAAVDRWGPENASQPAVRIDIRDSGPGIAENHIDMIFEPFFTTKASGTGLGLPLVRNTVQRHGGTVRVRRPESGGAVFSIFLPFKKNMG